MFTARGGNAGEAEHFVKLFGNCDVIGFDYKSETPWEAEKEFPAFFDELSYKYREIILIANKKE